MGDKERFLPVPKGGRTGVISGWNVQCDSRSRSSVVGEPVTTSLCLRSTAMRYSRSWRGIDWRSAGGLPAFAFAFVLAFGEPLPAGGVCLGQSSSSHVTSREAEDGGRQGWPYAAPPVLTWGRNVQSFSCSASR